MHADVQEAAERIERAVRALTAALTGGAGAEEVTACDWEVLRSLAAYADAADRPEYETSLTWVPPLLDIEAEEDDRDKVIHFATWVFAVADEQRAMSATAPDGPEQPITSAADVVSTRFDREVSWPDAAAYEQLGLDLELVRHTTHTMLPADDG